MPAFLYTNKYDSNYYFVAEAIRKGVSKAGFPSSCICGPRGAERSYTPYVQWLASGFALLMTIAVRPPVIANGVKQSMRVHWIASLRRMTENVAGSQRRGGGQAAEIATVPFRTAELHRIFPHDDT
jgi:hypothetical protein